MKLSLYFLAVCLLLIGTGEVFACTCMHLGSFQKPDQQLINMRRDSANAVFSGKVIKIVSSGASKDRRIISLKVHIKVIKVWKGVTTKNVVVSTVKASNFCGFPFKVNEQYLVYSKGNKNDLGTSLCTRTTTLKNAAEDIKF